MGDNDVLDIGGIELGQELLSEFFGGARRPILYRLGRVVAGEVISARHCRNIEPTLAQWPFQRLQTRYQQETLSVPCAYSYVR